MVEKLIKCNDCGRYMDNYSEVTPSNDGLICRECYVKGTGITIEELEKREAKEDKEIRDKLGVAGLLAYYKMSRGKYLFREWEKAHRETPSEMKEKYEKGKREKKGYPISFKEWDQDRRERDKFDTEERKRSREARDWWNSQVPAQQNRWLSEAYERHLKERAEDDLVSWMGVKCVKWWSLLCGIGAFVTVFTPSLLNPDIFFWISCQWVTLLIFLFYSNYAKQWDGKRKRRKVIERHERNEQKRRSNIPEELLPLEGYWESADCPFSNDVVMRDEFFLFKLEWYETDPYGDTQRLALWGGKTMWKWENGFMQCMCLPTDRFDRAEFSGSQYKYYTVVRALDMPLAFDRDCPDSGRYWVKEYYYNLSDNTHINGVWRMYAFKDADDIEERVKWDGAEWKVLKGVKVEEQLHWK